MEAGRSIRAAFVVALLLIVPACLSKDATAPKPALSLAGVVIILPPKDIAGLLRQCSRATPEPGQGSWELQTSDIGKMEAALPAALRQQEREEDWSKFPNGWARQYVGIVRNGRRYLYGNFAPAYPDTRTADPVVACDGGPAFFGAEYDVEAGRISHLAFNGVA